MNRRNFIQSLVAVFALPGRATLSLQSATGVLPSAVVVPARARSWAIYMSKLHGECTPQTLQNLLHTPEVDAKRYVSQLIAEGLIKPNPILQKSVSEILKSDEDGLFDKVKKRFEMKVKAESDEVEICESADETECLDAELELSEDLAEADLEIVAEDEIVELETQIPDETEVQS